MKILNLDKLTTSSGRFLTIANVRHEINAMSVDNFLSISQTAKSLIEQTSTPADHFNNVMDTIIMLAPTVPRIELAKLSLDALNTVAEFVRGGDVDEQEVFEQAAGETDAGK